MLEQGLRRWWKRKRNQELSPARQSEIEGWVRRSLDDLVHLGGLEACLEHHGIELELSQQPHCVAGVRFRARLDLHSRRLTMFAAALDELQERCGDRRLLSQVVMAHEVFHLLSPQCPAGLAEAAAHLFAARCCGLEEFPGNWDAPGE